MARRRNPVRYVEVDRSHDSGSSDFTTGLEEDAVLIGVSVLLVVGLGYLLYQKSQDAANAVVQGAINAKQAASDALTQAIQNALPSLPSTPGSGVPYTPPEGGPDPNTEPGYP